MQGIDATFDGVIFSAITQADQSALAFARTLCRSDAKTHDVRLNNIYVWKGSVNAAIADISMIIMVSTCAAVEISALLGDVET